MKFRQFPRGIMITKIIISRPSKDTMKLIKRQLENKEGEGKNMTLKSLKTLSVFIALKLDILRANIARCI